MTLVVSKSWVKGLSVAVGRQLTSDGGTARHSHSSKPCTLADVGPRQVVSKGPHYKPSPSTGLQGRLSSIVDDETLGHWCLGDLSRTPHKAGLHFVVLCKAGLHSCSAAFTGGAHAPQCWQLTITYCRGLETTVIRWQSLGPVVAVELAVLVARPVCGVSAPTAVAAGSMLQRPSLLNVSRQPSTQPIQSFERQSGSSNIPT